ncbi:hypothetical protein TKK_0011003 [Trichogramma kaykai]
MTDRNILALICLILLSTLSLSVNGNESTDIRCDEAILFKNWCHEMVPGTTCKDGFCRCHEGYHWTPHYRGCVQTRRFNQICYSPVQCLFHIDSQMRCEKQGPGKRSVCDCPWPLIVSRDRLFCKFAYPELDDMCECHDDCKKTNNSWCPMNHCVCRPYFRKVHGTRTQQQPHGTVL